MRISLPFTIEQFLDSMLQYHQSTWPAVWILGAVAVFVALLVYLKPTASNQKIALIFLGLLWGWMGAVYQLTFFARINPAANLFGALFLLQAAVLLRFAIRDARTSTPPKNARLLTATSVAFVLYALVIYPLLGFALGHGYPRGPIFGLPCPGTIFTFAILLAIKAQGRPVLAMAIIPIIWSAIGTVAAVQLGIIADWMLAVSAVLTMVLASGRLSEKPALAGTPP